MIRTENPNINSKLYWDYIYTNKKDQEILEKKVHFTDEWSVDDRTDTPVPPSKRFITALAQIKDGDKVLDIGCGFGIFTGAVIEKHPFNDVWGVDISSTAIEDNKKKHPDVTYFQQHVGNLDRVPENYFDVVFAGEIVEHLDDPNVLFTDAMSVLKDGGRFIVTTPKDDMIDSPEHVWYFTKDSIGELFEKNGFKNLEFIDLPEMEKESIIFAIGTK